MDITKDGVCVYYGIPLLNPCVGFYKRVHTGWFYKRVFLSTNGWISNGWIYNGWIYNGYFHGYFVSTDGRISSGSISNGWFSKGWICNGRIEEWIRLLWHLHFRVDTGIELAFVEVQNAQVAHVALVAPFGVPVAPQSSSVTTWRGGWWANDNVVVDDDAIGGGR
jgi:hypothetical protein